MLLTNPVTYYLTDHPSITNFRWSHTQSYVSTWSFLFTSLTLYLTLSISLHLLLHRNKPISLGPLPALHSLTMSVLSAVIFAGTILSAAAEIRDTRWLWRRRNTSSSIHWLLCFPLGTRPSGRVFFWSYIFYLSKFLLMSRTLFTILRRRKLVFLQLFYNSLLTFMSFLWLEFSQSFQILAILFTTLVYSVVYGYRFWTGIGLPRACFPLVINCQMVLFACNLICHVGVIFFHFMNGGGGCNGIGAWGFNSVLNAAIVLPFLRFYAKTMMDKKKSNVGGVGGEVNYR